MSVLAKRTNYLQKCGEGFSFYKRSSFLLALFSIYFLFMNLTFSQTATEDFNSPNDVFGGAYSGAGWVNNNWVRSGINNNATDVRALTTPDPFNNIPGNVLQLADNDAGAYRIINFNNAISASLSFIYDYDDTLDGGEELLIQIDPENDGTYITLQTITATNNSPNPAIVETITIPSIHLGGANTRIQFITGADNSINLNNEEWWIDNVVVTYTLASDSDGDGIFDAVDLDDDNDGVPDLEESENLIQAATFDDVIQANLGNNLAVAIAPWILTSGTTNIVKVNGSTSYGNAGPRLDANPYTLAGTEQHYFDISGVGDLYQSFTLTTSRTITYSGFFSPRDGNFGSGEIMIRQGVGNTGVIIDTSGNILINNNGGNSQNAPWTYVERTVVLAAGTYSMVVNMSNPTNFDEGKVQAIDLDSDGDGIPNMFDLDSDNDGIYDAVEAGHGQAHNNGVVTGNVGADGIPNSVQSAPNNGLINYTISDADADGVYDLNELDADNDACNDVAEAGYTDANNDGILGAAPTLVDSNGLVVVTAVTNGYTTPNDADGNLVFDFQELGFAPSITSEPLDLTAFVGNSASFFATLDNSDSYQWQISTDGGTTFTNISNGGLYAGTDTPTLTISNVTIAMNNYLFRLMGTNITYVCSPTVISRTAVLNIRTQTVITNRRITYRVNRS